MVRALRIPALSPGWQASFRALLEEEPGSGNAGLALTSPPPAWPGFHRLAVTAITRESDSVITIRLEDPKGARLPVGGSGTSRTGDFAIVGRGPPNSESAPLGWPARHHRVRAEPITRILLVARSRPVPDTGVGLSQQDRVLGGSASGYGHKEVSSTAETT